VDSALVYRFSHPDYPLLVPILAAQAANLAGFWNEQLPKSALVLLLVPPLASDSVVLESRVRHGRAAVHYMGQAYPVADQR